MILTVLLLTVVSTCLAQPADNNAQQRPARAPQSQIQYKDPDGLRVDWKFYAPQNQWKSQIAAAAQRSNRAETGTAQANFGAQQQSHVVQAPIEKQANYQPYSAIPNHIKQLLAQSYTPQGPYVDPSAFFYQTNAPAAVAAPAQSALPQVHKNHEDRSSLSQSQLEREYYNSAVTYRALGNNQQAEQYNSRQVGRIPSRLQGGIKYKHDVSASESRAEQLPYGSVIPAQSQPKPQYQAYRQIPQPQYQQHSNKQASQQPQQSQYQALTKQATRQPHLQYKTYKTSATSGNGAEAQANAYNGKMPMAIQQLLHYQAQLPYNVIANHILYRPKEPFIPKPLPESVKLARQYPSKIYFVKTDGQIYESPDTVKDSAPEKRH